MTQRLGNDGVKIGDLIRYADGVSALGRIHSRHAGGWHFEHVLGGFQFVFDHGWGLRGIFKPSEADIAFCRERKPDWFSEAADARP